MRAPPRHCEERSDEAIHFSRIDGLLRRYAPRKDGGVWIASSLRFSQRWGCMYCYLPPFRGKCLSACAKAMGGSLSHAGAGKIDRRFNCYCRSEFCTEECQVTPPTSFHSVTSPKKGKDRHIKKKTPSPMGEEVKCNEVRVLN